MASTGWCTTRHTATHRPTRRYHRAKSAIRFSFRTDFRALTTTSGSITQIKHIAIGWLGAFRLPRVNIGGLDSLARYFNVNKSLIEFHLNAFFSLFTAPDPPANLSVSVRSGKIALITWSPPSQGNFTSYKLKILGLSDFQYSNKTIVIDDDSFQYQMKDLTPGATYQIQAYTIFDGKESAAYTSRNFTTSELRISILEILHSANSIFDLTNWFGFILWCS